MTLFIAFLLFMFLLGMLLWRKSELVRYTVISIITLFMCYAYLYLNQI